MTFLGDPAVVNLAAQIKDLAAHMLAYGEVLELRTSIRSKLYADGAYYDAAKEKITMAHYENAYTTFKKWSGKNQ